MKFIQKKKDGMLRQVVKKKRREIVKMDETRVCHQSFISQETSGPRHLHSLSQLLNLVFQKLHTCTCVCERELGPAFMRAFNLLWKQFPFLAPNSSIYLSPKVDVAEFGR